VFFALWPDAEQRAALAQAVRKAVRSSGGRPVPTESLHVTLAFLGSVPEHRLPELDRIARRLAEASAADAPPVRLCFERLAHWKRAQILCALADSGDPTPAEAAAEAALAEATAAPGRAAGIAVGPDSAGSGAEAPTAAAVLAAALIEQTSAAGFRPDLKPFRSHVTVARKVVHAPARGERFAVEWDFGAFALIDSRTEPAGPVYSVVESYLLAKKEKAHE
jgi:RNA 2',3'-cyclic 3'-phosphodiesterase